jgi:hypothetical protein
MDDAVGSELRQILRRHGTGICRDPRLVAALLSGLQGDHHQAIRVLAGAVRAGVSAELVALPDTAASATVYGRLEQALRDSLGLGADAARWAIAAWAAALDIQEIIPVLDTNTPAGQAGVAAEFAGLAQGDSRPSVADTKVRDRLAGLAPDESGDATRAVLRLLTVAEGPLTVDDVAAILSVSRLRVSRAVQPVADLISRGWDLELAGPVRQALLGYLGQQELDASRQVLARWCAELLASGRYGAKFPDYVIRHGAVTLAAAGDIRALPWLIDREWMRLSAERTGSLSAFTRDMLLAAHAAAAKSPPDRIQELRATLAAVSSSAIAADVPPEAMGVMAMAGRRETAMDLAAMVALEARSDAYRRIAVALHSAGDSAADIAAAEAIASAVTCVREAGNHYPLLGLAQSLAKSGKSDWALRALAALRAETAASPDDDYLAREILHLAVEILTGAGDIDGAWQAARSIANPGSRDFVLGKFIVAALARAGRIQDAIDAAQPAAGTPWGQLGHIAAITAESGDAASTISVLRSIPSEHRQQGVIEAGTVWARAGRASDVLDLLQVIDDAERREGAARHLASTLAEGGRVDEALMVARTIGDGDRREHAVRSLADALARTGRAGRAASVWRAESADPNTEYFAAELAKVAAEVGDVDGALEVAAAIGSEHLRKTAITHAASAAARDGDLRRAAAVVRVIGNEPGEDHAFAVIAADLAAHDRLDKATAVIEIIVGTQPKAESQLKLATALMGAGKYVQAASTAQQAAEAAGTLGSSAVHARALITWARALALSSRSGEAAIPAEHAATLAGDTGDTELLADALAIWSGTLAMSGRAEDASAVAARALIAVNNEDELWPDASHYKRDRKAKSVAVIFAEAGQSDLAVSTSLSLASEWEQDGLLTEVAGTLVRRGLADQAITALKASPDFTYYTAENKLRELTRILARHGHGDAALQAAYAIASIEELHYAEFTVASMVCEAVRILAENGWVDVALAAVRASAPEWNKPAAYTGIACAVALAGDTRQAATIAETTVGYSALAKVADALMESGKLDEAAPLAEDAVRLALTMRPGFPDTFDALAALDRLSGAFGDRAAVEQSGDASGPGGDAAASAARQAAEEATAIQHLATRAAAEAAAAMRLALAGNPALMAEARSMAMQAVTDARDIADPGPKVLVLGNAAKAFALAGEDGPAADTASECLRTAAEQPFGAGDQGALLALGVLLDLGQVAETLAGIDVLKRDVTKVEAFCAIAKRLAEEGRTDDLRRLAEGTDVTERIAGGNQRISALTAIGRGLAEAQETRLASGVADEIARQAQGLTEPHEKASAQADQAELLAVLGRCSEAVELAAKALIAAEKPLRGWRGQVISTAVKVLIRCHKVGDAADAVREASAAAWANCVGEVGTALFAAGDPEVAPTLLSEALAALRAEGERGAFYDLICTQLPKYPALFRAWLGPGADLIQVRESLSTVERWWAELHDPVRRLHQSAWADACRNRAPVESLSVAVRSPRIWPGCSPRWWPVKSPIPRSSCRPGV